MKKLTGASDGQTPRLVVEGPRMSSTGAPVTAQQTPSFDPASKFSPVAQSPRALEGEARAQHVDDAIGAFEAEVAAANPAGFAAKMARIAMSPFHFFRGTAHLFVQDVKDLDLERPVVLGYGDAHVENMGVLRAPDGTLFYGLDDFDEAHPAPFAWDLRRGATALELIGRDQGLDAETRAGLVQAYVDGYFEALRAGPPEGHRFTAERGPKLLRRFIDEADDASRKKYLRKYVDKDQRFEATEKVHPAPARVPELQVAIEGYRAGLGPHAPKDADFYRVLDVAERTNAGTGSLGLRRYYVLLEGKSDKRKNDVILELKERRGPSAAAHFAQPAHQQRAADDGEGRVDQAWKQGDRFAGKVELDGRTFRVRERHPAHQRLDVADLDAKQLGAYAGVLGALVADFHGTHGPVRPVKHQDVGALTAEIQDFASAQAERTIDDHAAFVARRAAEA